MRPAEGKLLAPREIVKITLLSDESIRLEPIPGPMTIEALSTEQSYSPFHMLASSLAYCSWSVMYSWATNGGFSADDLVLEVSWKFADDPHRVGNIELTFRWPSLAPRRLAAARRVAELCAIHATLTHPPAISIEGTAGAESEVVAAGSEAQ